MKYYLFKQNNSGGYYIEDENLGISSNLIIKADNEDIADEIFDNISKQYGESFHSFCECCGPRWDVEYSEVFNQKELTSFLNDNRVKG